MLSREVMFDHLVWLRRGVEGGRAKTVAESGKRRHGLRLRRYGPRVRSAGSEEPRPVRWPGVAVAAQKATSPLNIARGKPTPAAFAGPPGSAQKALGIALLTPRRWSKIE